MQYVGENSDSYHRYISEVIILFLFISKYKGGGPSDVRSECQKSLKSCRDLSVMPMSNDIYK